ncbi:MAG: SLC13 family permease [Pirellulaceae bacterium]
MVDQPRAFSRVATAFGESCRKIGLLIAFASIIGGALTASRAAERIVHALLVPFRREAAPRALVIAGFVLGIPVFFDTVFLLLIPIARGLYRQTRKHYVLVLMSIVVGGTMAHSLVPPTPGPLSVAATLGVDFRATLVAGLLIGGLAAFVGYLFAAWIDRYWPIELDPDGAGSGRFGLRIRRRGTQTNRWEQATGGSSSRRRAASESALETQHRIASSLGIARADRRPADAHYPGDMFIGDGRSGGGLG